MYKITRKAFLTPSVCLMEVEAPRIAASAKPGQFLIVRSNETAERIPLTICDWDRNAGTVTIVTQIVGASSRIICNKGVGESFSDVAGPLGNPSDFCSLPDEQLKGRKYLMIGGGVGTAPVYPQVKYLQEHGAHCDVIIGARNSSLLIFADEMKSIAGRLFLCTDDGSVGEKGVVTAVAERLIGDGGKYDAAVSIGPMIMMKFCALTLKKYNIPLTVSLNSIMVDGTGMCGACRVSVGGKTRFACSEGPEFDGYEVDFDEAMRRQKLYRNEELAADERCRAKLGEDKQ
jgi:NAD(P)H-flavin reductase